MKAYKIEDVKDFMAILFLKEIFDKFNVINVEVKTMYPIEIKGNLNSDWLDEEQKEQLEGAEYVPWKLLRPVVFSLIRGNKTPSLLRINFVHYKENGDCGGLRVQYENNELVCISSYTEKSFSMSKENELMWDESCAQFLKKNQIILSEI